MNVDFRLTHGTAVALGGSGRDFLRCARPVPAGVRVKSGGMVTWTSPTLPRVSWSTKVCRYWTDTFGIDGIRFDNTVNFYQAGDPRGLPGVLDGITRHVAGKGEAN
jgi:hypothetical protein